MRGLIGIVAISFGLAVPALAQSNGAETALIGEDGPGAAHPDDLQFDGLDGDDVVLRDGTGRRYRIPRAFFLDDNDVAAAPAGAANEPPVTPGDPGQ